MARKITMAFGPLLCLGALALAQQVPDRSFRPPVDNPAFPAGDGPTVCVDEAHFNFHTLDGGFWAFGELLRRDGYRTAANTATFSREVPSRCRVLVISNAQPGSEDWDAYPYPTPSAFTEEEIRTLHEWVFEGGRLLLIADHMPLAGAAQALAAAFDVEFTDGFAFEGFDETTGVVESPPTIFSIETGTLRPHAITDGGSAAESVTRVRTFTGQAFRVPAEATPLLVLPRGFVSLMPERAWEFAPGMRRIQVEGWSQGAVMDVGEGRAAFFGEAAMFSAQSEGPSRSPMGMNAPMAEQNPRFVLNLVHWLSEQLN